MVLVREQVQIISVNVVHYVLGIAKKVDHGRLVAGGCWWKRLAGRPEAMIVVGLLVRV